VRSDVIDSLLTQDWLDSLAHYQTLYIGFSGGLDSTVLLHTIVRQPTLIGKVVAVHIHHGLSKNATSWQEHCQCQCDMLSIPLLVRDVQFNTRANIEEGARIARYQVFSSLLAEDDCLLLAHHADDQAETVLLQLFRGTGIDGLAAMASRGELAKGSLARPFLNHTRDTLEAYARHYQLAWIDDESNQNTAFSRNYLRQQIMPLLRAKWPGLVGNLGRSAIHCQQAKSNLDCLAEIDCQERVKSQDSLNLTPLLLLNQARLANVLRVWLRKNNVRCPTTVILQRLITDVILGRQDALAVVTWDGIVVRRYQQTIYLLKEESQNQLNCIEWSTFPTSLQLDGKGHRSLHVRSGSSQTSAGLKIPPNCIIQVRFRQGGETFHWRGQTKQLKKLYQQWQIPPWQRDMIPLLYVNGELAAVVGFAISDYFYATEPDNRYQIELHCS